MDEEFSASELSEISDAFSIVADTLSKLAEELDRQFEAFPVELEDKTKEFISEQRYQDALKVLEKYKDRDENIKSRLDDIYRSFKD